MKKSVVAGLAALIVWAATESALAASGEQGAKEEGSAIVANEAIKRLREGNERFVSGKPQHPHEARDWRAELERGQHPFAVILGCSDSRVPPELVFDQGFGDLFVVRVAGNIVDTDVTASVEYATDHLHAPLVVVMGHTDCGAVTATIDHLADVGNEPAEVVELMHRIEPAVVGIPKDLPRPRQIDQAVRKNVEYAVRHLSRVPDLRRGIQEGRVKIVGAVFDIHTGKVEVFE